MAVELDEAAPKTPAPQNGTGKAHKRHKSGGGGAPNGSLDAALGAKNLLGKLGAANVHANGANKDGAAAGGVSELPQRRINFVEMTVPDRALDQLRSKYPPINADAIKKAMKGHGSLGSEKGTGNQTSASAAGASPAAPPKEQILDPRHIPITWASVYPTAPGLVNLGNTCFLNASLQCIAHTAPLSEYLLSGHHSRTCRTKAATGMFCVTCELENLAKRMFRTGGGAGGGSFAPKGIVSNLRAVGKQFKVGRQEDAHEFVRMMVDAMQNSAVRSYFGKDVKRVDPDLSQTTLPSHLFSGKLRSRLVCLVCNYTSDTFDPFMDLPLDLSGPSIRSCLQGFVRAEVLRGRDAYWTCDKCQKRVETRKENRIARPPRVLCVQLKRFGFVKGMGTKITKRVNVDDTIDLAPCLVDGKEPCPYDLYAVTLHHGNSLRSGHYTAMVKGTNGVWWHMDDDRRNQVGWERVSKAAEGGAYLVWYIRREKRELKTAPAMGQSKSADPFAFGISPSPEKAVQGKVVLPPKPPVKVVANGDLGEKLTAEEAREVAKTQKKAEKKRKREEEIQRKLAEKAKADHADEDGEEDDEEPAREQKRRAVEGATKGVSAPVPKPVPRPAIIPSEATPQRQSKPSHVQSTGNWTISSGKEAATLNETPGLGMKALAGRSPWVVKDLIGVSAMKPKVVKKNSALRISASAPASIARKPAFVRPAEVEDEDMDGSDTSSDSSSGVAGDAPLPTGKDSQIEVAWDAPIESKRDALQSVIRRESHLHAGQDPLPQLINGNNDVAKIESWTASSAESGVAVADRWGAKPGGQAKIGVRPSSYDAEYDRGKVKKVKSKEDKLKRDKDRLRVADHFRRAGEEASRRAATAEGRMEDALDEAKRLRELDTKKMKEVPKRKVDEFADDEDW